MKNAHSPTPPSLFNESASNPYRRALGGIVPIDIPTLFVALAIYAGFGALTWFYRAIPIWVVAPLGAFCLAWHSSLQHETIHNHPTASRRINRALGCLPLSLWIPYRIYYTTHLKHHRHRGLHLTDAERDPESFYVATDSQLRSGFLLHCLRRANCTLAGRIVLGPAIAIGRFWRAELRSVLQGEARRMIIWARHFMAVSLLVIWLRWVCHIPVEVYLFLIVYPSISLTHLRSFAEHRADSTVSQRTVTVEAGPLWSLLFLNNNLHIAHHAHPRISWYRLPVIWRRMRAEAVERGRVVEGGYTQLGRRYFFTPIILLERSTRVSERQRELLAADT